MKLLVYLVVRLHSCCNVVLGPVYTKHQRQRCNHSAIMIAILFSLKSIETLENGLQTHSGASLQSCRRVDTDVGVNGALNRDLRIRTYAPSAHTFFSVGMLNRIQEQCQWCPYSQPTLTPWAYAASAVTGNGYAAALTSSLHLHCYIRSCQTSLFISCSLWG